MLSDEDKRRIIGFYKSDGEPGLWLLWDQKLSEVAQEYPQLADAWQRYKQAEANMQAAMEGLATEVGEDLSDDGGLN